LIVLNLFQYKLWKLLSLRFTNTNINLRQYYLPIHNNLRILYKSVFYKDEHKFLCQNKKTNKLRYRQGVHMLIDNYLQKFNLNLNQLCINTILHFYYFYQSTISETTKEFNISATTFYKIKNDSLIYLDSNYLQ
jgi:hypothetical protein